MPITCWPEPHVSGEADAHGQEIEGMIQVTVGVTGGAAAWRWFSCLRTGDASDARGYIVRHAATRFINAPPALCHADPPAEGTAYESRVPQVNGTWIDRLFR